MPFVTPPSTPAASVIVADEGSTQGTATILNFVGAGVAATYSGGTGVITIAGGTAAGSLIIQDEGSTIGTATVLNIVGAGGTASFSGGTATLTISSSGGGGTAARVVLTSGSLTTTSTSFVDATGLSITATTGANPVLVGFIGNVYHSANQAGVYIQLDIDGTDQGGTFGLAGETTISGGNDAHNASFTYMTEALSAASHTFKIQWRVTSGTGNLYADSQIPAVLWIKELA